MAWHGMNDDLVALVSHQHHDLEQVGGAVGADGEPTIGILSEVLDRHREVDGVEHVFVGHAVTSGRGVDIHTGLLHYEMVAGGAADAASIRSSAICSSPGIAPTYVDTSVSTQ